MSGCVACDFSGMGMCLDCRKREWELPNFGYIVVPANVHQGVQRWHVKRLGAEFGDSTVTVCFDEAMAQHIRDLLQKDMEQQELRAALHGARVSVSDAEDDGA